MSTYVMSDIHAGYIEKAEDIDMSLDDLQHFYLYAREKGYRMGGKQHGMIIAGHTPTLIKGEFTYNEGNVFREWDGNSPPAARSG